MNSNGDSREDCNNVSAMFTAHAVVLLQRGHANSKFGCYDSTATDHPLLDDLNYKDSKQLKRLVHDTFPNCNINHIHRVNAPQMYGMYLLRKEEMQLTIGRDDGQELMLYHVTTKSRALESLNTGLDWRRIRRSKFGCGVSFSDDADYANYYANQSSPEDTRVIIMCAVMVKNTYRVTVKWNMENLIVPPGMADTTMSFSNRVYVKYNDYDFYPLYFMYYQRSLELRNESKYFNGKQKLSKWRQREQARRQREQARRHREQARRYREQARRHREQARRQREQPQRQQDLKPAQLQRDLEDAQGQQKRKRDLEQAQDQQKREQARRKREQVQREEALQQREREQTQRKRDQEEAYRQREREQVKRHRDREQTHRERERELAQRHRDREQRHRERERELVQRHRYREQAYRQRKREREREQARHRRQQRREQAQRRQLREQAQRKRNREQHSGRHTT